MIELEEHCREIRRAAILFSGGPAPAANAVISTAAHSFIDRGLEVVGIRHGYRNLVQFGPDRPMRIDEDYILLTQEVVKRTRNSQGILVGTARTNPGKLIHHLDHLRDDEYCQPLKCVYDALVSLEVDALISIGGDDTLKTANKLKLYQERFPQEKRIPIVHLPKTIDNDYKGIDFTFGYFTAVHTLGEEIRNLLHDAEAGSVYFLAETMGRSAGWLAYGAAIAGEASFVFSVEDIVGDYRQTETYADVVTGETTQREVMNLDKVVGRIVKTMIARQKKRKDYGVVVLAEGLAEYLPMQHLEGVPRDEHNHIAISQVDLGRKFAKWVAAQYKSQTGHSRKITGVQLGYESRCAQPHAFDVMLGSQLGVGAYRALVEKRLDGVMVSVVGQLELHYVSFKELVDQETLVTKVRFIEPNSDFHRLARFLETDVND